MLWVPKAKGLKDTSDSRAMSVRDMDSDSVTCHRSLSDSTIVDSEMNMRISDLPYHTRRSNRGLSDSQFVAGLAQQIHEESTVTTNSTLTDATSSSNSKHTSPGGSPERRKKEVTFDLNPVFRRYAPQEEERTPSPADRAKYAARKWKEDRERRERQRRERREDYYYRRSRRSASEEENESTEENVHVPHFVRTYVPFGGEQMVVDHDEGLKEKEAAKKRQQQQRGALSEDMQRRLSQLLNQGVDMCYETQCKPGVGCVIA
mmetsp:Transcript_14112/g.19593  ORF Transcript_14112/g.19593 Transcript_14112/m.19593 type:complete len:261 (+) Transcript_14112:159-941(+)|eukprot:CAMPEP_0184504986 /NCGR_PEP_ID=MMETSP0113_2-20130426/52750_1 /TAXON_ID=91329 /ORGANISM="Norrisiella sphaerica, Strain BC52" /LENGTH=260 /DNA_ID=CAMNT_0026894651 /DNA_START=106 /DNA_END=888 /DNA_ORIENTATION=+